MTEMDEFADDLLKNLFRDVQPNRKQSLKELFEQRVQELRIKQTNVLDILNIEYRTLNGILEGSQKRVDFTNLLKIANFLQISNEKVISLYMETLGENFSSELSTSPEVIEFIRTNFDLATLKKSGFINNLNDFEEIEKKLVSFLGLKTIFDYKRLPVDVAFSAGLRKPKNELTRSLWIKTANEYFKEINNPNEYNRQALVDYFPNIRWHSTNVELGLINVIKDLYKVGVTVIYQSQLPSLHLRGATFSVNDQPCIVISNYVGYYPTLWFALVHELFHVIFDWEEIKRNNYHLSDDDADQLSVIEKEKEADGFAREFLFSRDKSEKVKPFLNNTKYIEEFAFNNHVHPSFVYVFNAYDVGKRERLAWMRAKQSNPSIKEILSKLENPWSNPKPIVEFIKTIKYSIYK